MKSFNENIEIDFDPIEHKYTHEGKKLKGGTTVTAEYHDGFDRERIASAFASKRNIDMPDVLALWDSGGNIAAGFGTAIHAVLEHYFTWKDKWEDCKAMPNHPFLIQLIKELEEIRIDGNTRQEVLVSLVDKGVCGLVDDLLITGKKTCRVRDYKITYNILENDKALYKPFTYLGSNKLAKNFLQLSIYSYMLEMSGWKVEGIDIYNWNGEWSHHMLEGDTLRKTILLVGTVV